jgi:hypothetical protein
LKRAQDARAPVWSFAIVASLSAIALRPRRKCLLHGSASGAAIEFTFGARVGIRQLERRFRCENGEQGINAFPFINAVGERRL